MKVADNREVFTVTLLNESVRDLLENSFPGVWVEGEISNLAQPSSGHMYFTLKDEGAQIRAAMFRGNSRFLRFTPKNGQKVLVKARLSLYAPRGDYQLIVEQMEEAGLGALQRAFEQLRQKLLQEGLFDPANKKPLPEFPRHLGVITSPTGAAIRDILSVLGRRFPGLPVTVIPVPVQGNEAAPAIVRAISLANRSGLFDVLLLSRGGGSLEDLWAFNEEVVARAIAASELPIVSGVGHEVDFTIADFVADVRAPTPSAAAELISPNGNELRDSFAGYEILLERAMRKTLQLHQQTLSHLQPRLKHPGRRIQELQQRLDEWELRLKRATEQQLQRRHTLVHHHTRQLRAHSPAQRLLQYRLRLEHLAQQANRGMQQQLHETRQQLEFLGQRAHLASPLATLGRGYAIVEQQGRIVRSTNDVRSGEPIKARLAQGFINATVTSVEE